MAGHKFKIGQTVYLRLKKVKVPVNSALVPYQIVRRLPAVKGQLQYAIKSSYDNHERVARESELIGV
jgi:hypothetical protein